MDQIRVGRISSLNYEAGAARVVYKDRDEAVTVEMPLLSFEYRMPQVDDLVMVLHLPNGATAGLLLGRYWNQENKPPESGEGLWRKDVDDTPGTCYFRWRDGHLTIHVDGSCTVECSGNLNVTAPGGDVLVNGISLTKHTHICPDGETSGPQ